jgi:sterol desaturase/sphingolipid hydroxylase (fatty acid hydroxylase superfamily)
VISIPVYLQIIAGLVLFALIFVTLEHRLPLKSQKIFRRGWSTDVKYFVAGCLAGQFSTAASIAIIVFVRQITGLHYPQIASHQPGWLQFLEILLLFDFLGYVFHRAMHRFPWLWRFHCIHHSSEEMDWLVNVRVHPVDKILSDCVQIIPTLMLGFSPVPLLAFTAFLGIQGFLVHSNLRLNYGPLRWILVGPQFHHWHHSNDRRAYDRNFAPHLVIFDLLFGTARLPPPDAMPAGYGVTDEVPEGFLSQLIHPFRRQHRGKFRRPLRPPYDPAAGSQT